MEVVLLRLEERMKYALRVKDKKLLDEVFKDIYNEYFHLIGFVISEYVNNKNDVEELINDVFLSFFNNLDKIKLKNIKAYLTKTAKNKAIDFIRRNKNKYLLENEIVNTPSIDNGLYYLIVNDMKRVLTVEEIDIIILHVVYDLSFKLIAKKYKLPITTISTKYYQAIKKNKDGGISWD